MCVLLFLVVVLLLLLWLLFILNFIFFFLFMHILIRARVFIFEIWKLLFFVAAVVVAISCSLHVYYVYRFESVRYHVCFILFFFFLFVINFFRSMQCIGELILANCVVNFFLAAFRFEY